MLCFTLILTFAAWMLDGTEIVHLKVRIWAQNDWQISRTKILVIMRNSKHSNEPKDFKGQLQRFYKLMSYERAFKMLTNDMCITEIGQAVLELWSSKDGSGNPHWRWVGESFCKNWSPQNRQNLPLLKTRLYLLVGISPRVFTGFDWLRSKLINIFS